MKKIVQLSIIVVFFAALLAGCAAPVAASQAIQLVDGLERTVSLDQPAQKIVSMSPSTTELLFAVGAGNQVIGRDSFSDYPESVLQLPDIGGSMGDYSIETIASLELVFYMRDEFEPCKPRKLQVHLW